MGDLETKTSDDDKFRNFVKDLLKKHSGLNDETVDILTDAAGLPLFQQAFTSKMFSPLNNYEQLEFIGDTLVNDAVSLFIFNKYPGFTVEWLTLIKHSIISSLGLSTVANELNFWPHIRYKLERKENEKERRRKACRTICPTNSAHRLFNSSPTAFQQLFNSFSTALQQLFKKFARSLLFNCSSTILQTTLKKNPDSVLGHFVK